MSTDPDFPTHDVTPYGIEGLCAAWSEWVLRSGPVSVKPVYRSTMVLETYLGPRLIPPRLLSTPVRLSRIKSLGRIADTGEFELTPRRPVAVPRKTLGLRR